MTNQDLERRIRELEEENAFLRHGISDALLQAGTASTFLTASSDIGLLDQILATARQVCRAEGAGLFLVDESTNELVFELIHGGGGAAIRGLRVPMGHGIVGFAASPGQAIAVRDVAKDPRWAKDIGMRAGYQPVTLLSVPMIYNDQVVGVIQLLDKESGQPFGNEDIATLSNFANLSAFALQQARVLRDSAMILKLLLTGTPASASPLVERLIVTAGQTGASAEYAEMLSVAVQLGEIGRRGPGARRLCKDLVASVHHYFGASASR